jgi:protein ImuA
LNGLQTDIISRLKKDILSLQGFKTLAGNDRIDIGPMRHAFPNKTFPLGAIHEFICDNRSDAAASCGFVSGLLHYYIKPNSAIVWISGQRTIFPPAFIQFGIQPEQIIFIDVKKRNDILWVMEEALKCGGLAAVIGEMNELNFATSRRLQLAVENSKVTGFIFLQQPKSINTTTCVTRWRISSASSESPDGLPGINHPRWKAELIKVRNGKPGTWMIEWKNKKFQTILPAETITELHQKTG